MFSIPDYSDRVLELERDLLEGLEIISFTNGIGGAHLTPSSFAQLFSSIISHYIKRNELIFSSHKNIPNSLSVRFSFDGTHNVYRSSSEKNFEILYFQFLDVVDPQHEKHVFHIRPSIFF